MTGTRDSMFPRRVRKTGCGDRQTGFTLFELMEAAIVAGLPATVLFECLSRTCQIVIYFLSRHKGRGMVCDSGSLQRNRIGQPTAPIGRGFTTDAIESIPMQLAA
jgi:hypothetical protein